MDVPTDNSFVCCVCSTECTAYRKLKKHYKKQHQEYDLLRCSFCKFVTVSQSGMKKHKKREHPQDRFACSHCDFTTKSWKRWQLHVTSFHQEENVPNTTANALDTSSLHSQIDSKHFDKQSDSLVGFNPKKSKTYFTDQNTKGQPGMAGYANSGSIKEERTSPNASSSYVTLAVSKVTNVLNASCQQLPSNSFQEETGPSQNTSPAEVALKYCKKVNVSNLTSSTDVPGCDSELTLYEFDFHELKCQHCGVSRQGVDLKSDVCSSCDLSKQLSKTLSTSKVSSSSNSLHVCQVCEKSFSKKINLTYHMRIHTGDRPFECEYCEYTCAQKTTLEQHIRGHLGVKPYKCKVCEYSSAYRSNVLLHTTTHYIDRPYACEFCSLTFKRKDHLRNHTRRKHDQLI